jgi:hypothetical protein
MPSMNVRMEARRGKTLNLCDRIPHLVEVERALQSGNSLANPRAVMGGPGNSARAALWFSTSAPPWWEARTGLRLRVNETRSLTARIEIRVVVTI